MNRILGPRVTGDGHIQNRVAGKNAFGTFEIAQDGIDMETAPATEAARQWQGWGTALKPAWEPIILARKPLEGTVAQNVQKYGTGALNIDGCRVGHSEPEKRTERRADKFGRTHANGTGWRGKPEQQTIASPSAKGRWPANLIHDGSGEVLELFPETKSGTRNVGVRNGMGFHGANGDGGPAIVGNEGSAARFFYCAKASRSERGKGNTHPTVKPVELMRYLIRLVTPPGGVVLDPFMGSGTTITAAEALGFQAIGIDKEEDYCRIWSGRTTQRGLELG